MNSKKQIIVSAAAIRHFQKKAKKMNAILKKKNPLDAAIRNDI